MVCSYVYEPAVLTLITQPPQKRAPTVLMADMPCGQGTADRIEIGR
jgi:hypothetical protein